MWLDQCVPLRVSLCDQAQSRALSNSVFLPMGAPIEASIELRNSAQRIPMGRNTLVKKLHSFFVKFLYRKNNFLTPLRSLTQIKTDKSSFKQKYI